MSSSHAHPVKQCFCPHADLLQQAVWTPTVVETQLVVAAPQQLPSPPATSSAAAAVRSPTAFDAVLLSIIHVTDDLSLATGGLLELTAAAEEGVSANSLDSSSATGAATTANATVAQVRQVLQPAAATAPHLVDAAGPTVPLLPGTAAQRVSQQALTVAAEALRLATLLEGEDGGCDPAEQELLQQIAAAARLVSVMAADIVQPGPMQSGTEAASEGSGASISSTAAAVSGSEARAGNDNGTSSAEGLSLHNFAGLPVLGLQQQLCQASGDGAAGAVAPGLQCLHL